MLAKMVVSVASSRVQQSKHPPSVEAETADRETTFGIESVMKRECFNCGVILNSLFKLGIPSFEALSYVEGKEFRARAYV